MSREETYRVSKKQTQGSRQYLQMEMARIDVMIQREVNRWQRAGQRIDDEFRGLYMTDEDANALLERPFAVSWGQTVEADAQDVQMNKLLKHIEEQNRIFLEELCAKGDYPRLAFLTEMFGLDRVDLDILLICLAPALDLGYERLYGYLQDDVTRKHPTLNLILDLLGQPGVARFDLWQHFLDDAPLFRERLIQKADPQNEKPVQLNQMLLADETLVNWLLGHYAPAPEMGNSAQLLFPSTSSADDLLADHILDDYEPTTFGKHALVFCGPDHARKLAAARQLAVRESRPLLLVDLGEGLEQTPLMLLLRLALRDARLNRAIPMLMGWDATLNEDRVLPAGILSMIAEYPDTIILTAEKQLHPHRKSSENVFLFFHFNQPTFIQRSRVWEHFLNELSNPTLDMEMVAGQFQLTAEQIQDAFLTARDAAAQRGSDLNNDDLFAAARFYSNQRLSSLAKKIDPRYGWEDIILPDDQVSILREIINTVRTRPLVLEKWGLRNKLASSYGVATLFAGPPGTGKTMAAEIIAAELGLDLYKIDLSSVVSKYIGETEKNISKIFEEAETSNAILFFDEADALFGKRSEVRDSHDRYANIEISYLLQRMEAYDGVTILATNLRANLDEAFTRRLQFIVDFPFPQETDRLRIWRALFPKDIPCEDDIDFPFLAKRFKLAGANIRNIIVGAVFLAAADEKKVGMRHLLHGTHRELQKMRRLIEDETLHISREDG